MATSKALQDGRWWEETRTSIGSTRVVHSAIPQTARWRAETKGEKINTEDRDREEMKLFEADGTLWVTRHADQRMVQRNLSVEDIHYVLLYGQTLHKAGAIFTFLRKKDIPQVDLTNPRFQKLIGTTVVMAKEDGYHILTAYRTRHLGLRRIKRKSDYGW